MAKTPKPGASEPEDKGIDVITLREHNHVILMDRFSTWITLSKNRSEKEKDPETLVDAADYALGLFKTLLAQVPITDQPQKKPEKPAEPAKPDDTATQD